MPTSPFETSRFPTPSESEEPPQDEMDQLRTLLFGRKLDELESRFRQLDQSFKASLEIIKIDMERMIQQGREQINEELETMKEVLSREVAVIRDELDGKLAEESANRTGDLTTLTKQAQEGFTNVQLAINGIEQRHAESEMALQKGLSEKTRFIHEEMQATVKNLTNYLDSQTRELRDTKLDKDDLSKALQFVAGGLAPKVRPQTGNSPQP